MARGQRTRRRASRRRTSTKKKGGKTYGRDWERIKLQVLEHAINNEKIIQEFTLEKIKQIIDNFSNTLKQLPPTLEPEYLKKLAKEGFNRLRNSSNVDGSQIGGEITVVSWFGILCVFYCIYDALLGGGGPLRERDTEITLTRQLSNPGTPPASP